MPAKVLWRIRVFTLPMLGNLQDCRLVAKANTGYLHCALNCTMNDYLKETESLKVNYGRQLLVHIAYSVFVRLTDSSESNIWTSSFAYASVLLFCFPAPPRIPLGNLQRFPRPSIAGLIWFSDSFRVYQIRFRLGSVQTWRGELTSLPRPPSSFKMTYF